MTSSIGLCQCGCGLPTRIAPVTDKSKGWIKGAPLKFLFGHNLNINGGGTGSARWRGGRSISSNGYVVLWTPEGRRYEHIIIAERSLGRRLLQISKGHPDNEVVHHIDGNKTNNSPENLLICSHRYHAELHHRLEMSPAWPQFQKIERNKKERLNDYCNGTR